MTKAAELVIWMAPPLPLGADVATGEPVAEAVKAEVAGVVVSVRAKLEVLLHVSDHFLFSDRSGTYLIVEFPVAVLLLPNPIVVVMLADICVVILLLAEVVEVALSSTSENCPE